jgi:hypothetical protein
MEVAEGQEPMEAAEGQEPMEAVECQQPMEAAEEQQPINEERLKVKGHMLDFIISILRGDSSNEDDEVTSSTISQFKSFLNKNYKKYRNNHHIADCHANINIVDSTIADVIDLTNEE